MKKKNTFFFQQQNRLKKKKTKRKPFYDCLIYLFPSDYHDKFAHAYIFKIHKHTYIKPYIYMTYTYIY